MSKSRQNGFTLIELMVVFAISGLLLVIAFIGQRGLRAQAQFDATIDKVVSTISQARNEATAGVNVSGAGDGATNTPGCAGGDYVFAGTMWTADNSSTAQAKFSVDYYKAQIDKSVDPLGVMTGTACDFDTRTISTATDLMTNISNPAATRGGRILYVRTITGGLVVCQMTDLTQDVKPSFASGACIAPAVTVPAPVSPTWWVIDVSDADGHTSQILIDQGGLAKRQN